MDIINDIKGQGINFHDQTGPNKDLSSRTITNLQECESLVEDANENPDLLYEVEIMITNGSIETQPGPCLEVLKKCNRISTLKVYLQRKLTINQDL